MSLTQSEFGSARPWPADRPERWPIERLISYANNARIHTEADLAKIAASITKWGWTMPVLADEDGVLIAGHLRITLAGLHRPCARHHASGQSFDQRAETTDQDKSGAADGEKTFYRD
jgi:hypothetical protein